MCVRMLCGGAHDCTREPAEHAGCLGTKIIGICGMLGLFHGGCDHIHTHTHIWRARVCVCVRTHTCLTKGWKDSSLVKSKITPTSPSKRSLCAILIDLGPLTSSLLLIPVFLLLCPHKKEQLQLETDFLSV